MPSMTIETIVLWCSPTVFKNFDQKSVAACWEYTMFLIWWFYQTAIWCHNWTMFCLFSSVSVSCLELNFSQVCFLLFNTNHEKLEQVYHQDQLYLWLSSMKGHTLTLTILNPPFLIGFFFNRISAFDKGPVRIETSGPQFFFRIVHMYTYM